MPFSPMRGANSFPKFLAGYEGPLQGGGSEGEREGRDEKELKKRYERARGNTHPK